MINYIRRSKICCFVDCGFKKKNIKNSKSRPINSERHHIFVNSWVFLFWPQTHEDVLLLIRYQANIFFVWLCVIRLQLANRLANIHYKDVIMGAMSFEISSLTAVYSTVYSGAGQRKHQSSASLAFVTSEFPAQMASNAENVSIWWRRHDFTQKRRISSLEYMRDNENE